LIQESPKIVPPGAPSHGIEKSKKHRVLLAAFEIARTKDIRNPANGDRIAQTKRYWSVVPHCHLKNWDFNLLIRQYRRPS